MAKTEDIFMLHSEQSEEYNRLFEKYSKMSDEKLSEIMKADSGYKELAVKAASDVLHSDRTKYYKSIEQEQQTGNEKTELTVEEILISLHKDIRSIKRMMIFFVTLAVLGIISAIFLGFEIQRYLKI